MKRGLLQIAIILSISALVAAQSGNQSGNTPAPPQSAPTPMIRAADLLPDFSTDRSMISDEGKGKRHVEEQSHGGADDRALQQLEAGRKAEDVAREVGVSKHTIYAWKAKYGGMDVSEAQRSQATAGRKHAAEEAGGGSEAGGPGF